MSTLPNFLFYFVTVITLLVVSLTIYIQLTPCHEIKLIREGNIAASISFLGTMSGMAFVICSAVVFSVDYIDMLIWSGIGLVMQLGIYLLISKVFGNIHHFIAEEKCVAHGIILGGASAIAGLLQAACMVY
jgi:putative membrane protein